MINKPTLFINESSCCIDLVFTSNSSFVKNCESELPIYQKGHHNIKLQCTPPSSLLYRCLEIQTCKY